MYEQTRTPEQARDLGMAHTGLLHGGGVVDSNYNGFRWRGWRDEYYPPGNTDANASDDLLIAHNTLMLGPLIIYLGLKWRAMLRNANRKDFLFNELALQVWARTGHYVPYAWNLMNFFVELILKPLWLVMTLLLCAGARQHNFVVDFLLRVVVMEILINMSNFHAVS